MHTHVFMQQKPNCIFKLASNLLHAAVFVDAKPMQQVYYCMVQTCLIGLMHTCVSIIIAEKLLHLWWGNVWRAPCFKTNTHHVSVSDVYPRLMRDSFAAIKLLQMCVLGWCVSILKHWARHTLLHHRCSSFATTIMDTHIHQTYQAVLPHAANAAE